MASMGLACSSPACGGAAPLCRRSSFSGAALPARLEARRPIVPSAVAFVVTAKRAKVKGGWGLEPRDAGTEASALAKGEGLLNTLSKHTDGAADDEDELKARGLESKHRWSAIRDSLRPTQEALGWDWAFSKLSHFSTAADAQSYVGRKKVPYVQRGKLKYVVDHHHTLCALAMSGWDPEITLLELSVAKEEDRSLEAFWGYMEGRGWAFMRDEKYQRTPFTKIPTRFEITDFRNDVYRSMGGFARAHGILKRGEDLEDRLFFEFRWGYFFWLHTVNDQKLWPDTMEHRAFSRALHLVDDIDMHEHRLAINRDRSDADRSGANLANVESLIKLHYNAISPAYRMLMYSLRHLCYAYNDQVGKARDVPGLREIFGSASAQLPGRVVHDEENWKPPEND